MRIVSAEEMRALDRDAIRRLGLPELVLMENAGAQVASQLIEATDDKLWQEGCQVVVLSGPGKNGADGIVAARHLVMAGIEPQLLLVGGGKRSTALSKQLKIWQGLGFSATTIKSGTDFKAWIAEQSFDQRVVVDALFGIGLSIGPSRPLTGIFHEVIEWINREADFVLSVDIPSGLHADDGTALGCVVQADLTVTMGQPKRGMFVAAGPLNCGELVVASLGFIPQIDQVLKAEPIYLIEPKQFIASFTPRKSDSHKGDHGHVLVVAGSPEKSGAAVLTSKAAMRAGAGLVTLATPASAHTIIKSQLLEVMSESLPEAEGSPGGLDPQALEKILTLAKNCRALAIGPGLKNHPGLTELLRSLIPQLEVPCVCDADALNALADDLALLKQAHAPLVLTPHPGEMARLLKKSSDYVQAQRLQAAHDFAKQYGVHLLLKGFRSVIATPTGELYINPTGNAGMATAGMGDILTGIIAGYLAQGMQLPQALLAAAYNHGLAGDQACERQGERGMLATDVMNELPHLQTSFYAPH